MKRWIFALLVTLFAASAYAQNPPGNGQASPQVQLMNSYFPLTPISATAAVNTATTLTIPAPTNPTFYNYICWLAYEAVNDGTGTAVSAQVTTSTNFNSFAVKFSQIATGSADSGVQSVLGAMTPSSGCYKSTLPGTATTFVSPSGQTHLSWTWYAGYFQAP